MLRFHQPAWLQLSLRSADYWDRFQHSSVFSAPRSVGPEPWEHQTSWETSWSPKKKSNIFTSWWFSLEYVRHYSLYQIIYITLCCLKPCHIHTHTHTPPHLVFLLRFDLASNSNSKTDLCIQGTAWWYTFLHTKLFIISINIMSAFVGWFAIFLSVKVVVWFNFTWKKLTFCWEETNCKHDSDETVCVCVCFNIVMNKLNVHRPVSIIVCFLIDLLVLIHVCVDMLRWSCSIIYLCTKKNHSYMPSYFTW